MQPTLFLTLTLASLGAALVARSADAEAAAPIEARAIDPRYACTKDTDCAVVNHGNCCGYYPVCALPGSSWTAEEICKPGTASVCGWPSIDKCACIEGACNGMQNGNVVIRPFE